MNRPSVVFISMRLTPHQVPFCSEMVRLCSDFTFFQLSDLGDCWTAKGEEIRKQDYDYLQLYSDTPACRQKIMDADVVLLGGADLSLVEERLRAGKIVFVYLERFYKKGITAANFFRCLAGTYLHHGRFQKYNVNLLCASAYCAGDAAIFGNYKNRTYKWGYFPKVEDCDADLEKEPDQLIWVGRLIDWKHAEYAVMAMADLCKDHPSAQLKIYGSGDEENSIRALVTRLHLEKNIHVMGEAPAETIKEEMKRAAVFLSTSDYQEGWGAVLNEAMNCKCAVVASHAAGSTPFLIQNGENGYIWSCGDVRQMADFCRELIDHPDKRAKMAESAYRTIKDVWNPAQAAERFLGLAKALTDGEKTPYDDGPCSIALPIRQSKMYSFISGENNA